MFNTNIFSADAEKKYKIKALVHPVAECILVSVTPLDEDRLRGTGLPVVVDQCQKTHKTSKSKLASRH